MESVGNIEVDRRKLAISGKDLSQLVKPGHGCQFQLVSCDVHDLDTDAEPHEGPENDGEHDEIFDDCEMVDLAAKEDRMRREFISHILNTNKDPIKPGAKSRFHGFREINEMEASFELDLNSLEDRHIGIHRMYEKIGSFNDYKKNNPFEEVSQGRVYKLKRMAGVKLPVTAESLVIYNCALWTEGAKEPFDSTWLRRTTLTAHLSTDSILPGLHELLMSSCKGELCEALIKPEAAFGPLGAPPRIPPNATIFCLLEVVNVVTREKMAILTNLAGKSETSKGIAFEDYLDASDEARQRGNYYYQNELYKIALQRYKSGIRLLEGLSCKDEEQEKTLNELLIKLYNNCAKTANAMGIPRLALSACKQASMINDLVPKTYWNRMVAWKKKGHLDRALGVTRRALQLFTDADPAILRSFQKAANELKLSIQQERAEESDLYRLMGKAYIAPLSTVKA